MRGIHAAATLTAEWLTAELPRALARARDLDGLTAADLPDPEHVWGHDVNQLGAEDWPAVLVVPKLTTDMRLIDVLDAAAELYAVTYSLTVYGWVRHEDYELTARARDRYGLAIREALLTRKQLTAAAAWGDDPGPGTAWVKPETIREDYGPAVNDGARTIAGVEVTFEVTLVEVLDGPTPVGDAAQAPDVAVRSTPTATGGDTTTPIRPLPPHPALD